MPGHVHAGVGEREQRHDHVAGPRVQAVLEPLVGRDRRQQALACGARQLRSRLLAKRVRQRDAALQILARGCIGAGHKSDGETRDHRIDAGLEHRDPQRDGHRHRKRRANGADASQTHEHAEQADGDRERDQRHVRRVDERDHDERAQIVDHREGEQEHAQPRRRTWCEQRERTEREGAVGRHRRPPPVRARAASVERQIDRDRHDDPADRRQHRDHHPSAFAQLSQIELALGLETHDQEEDGHQPFVHPDAKVRRDPRAADAYRQRRRPHGLVGVPPRRVRPHQRRHRRERHHGRATGLRTQKVANRRPQIPRPRRPPPVRPGLGRSAHRHAITAAIIAQRDANPPPARHRSAAPGSAGNSELGRSEAVGKPSVFLENGSRTRARGPQLRGLPVGVEGAAVERCRRDSGSAQGMQSG